MLVVPKTYEKTLSLIHNKMNASSNYIKMPIFAYQFGNNPKVSAVIGNRATAVILPEGVLIGSSLWKTIGINYQKYKYTYLRTLWSYFWEFIPHYRCTTGK